MSKKKNICVLGANGFVGKHLIGRLSIEGHTVRALTRHAHRARDLKLLPNLELIETDVHSPEALSSALEGCDAVINLVGVLSAPGGAEDFRRIHVDLAARLVQAARTAGVTRLLHMSTLNADAGNPDNEYLRSKGEAEDLVHDESNGLAVTSFRPSLIFGPQDRFFNRFASMLRNMPLLPLPCPAVRVAPVYLGDVAQGFMEALSDDSLAGRRVDLYGPRIYTLEEMVRYTAQVIGSRSIIIPLSDKASGIHARLLDNLPGRPFSLDALFALQVSTTPAEGPPCPTAVESVVPFYLGKRESQNHLQHLRSQERQT